MDDYILKATAADGMVRGFFATTKYTVNASFHIHKTSPVVTAAMGRMLTAAAIMGSMLKNNDDLVTIIIKGDGPMKGIVVSSDKNSRVKGYPYNSIVDINLKENGKLNVSEAIGEGFLSVVRDSGLKELYTGQIPLVSGEIAEDLTYYFSKSEQVPSAVALGVLVDRDYSARHSGGFIIQLLPDAPKELANILEIKLQTFPPITELFENGKKPEDLLDMLFGEFGYKINERQPVDYFCNCDKERVRKAFISIGRLELEKILEEDGQATLHCHFCNKDYYFGQKDIEEVIKGF